MELNVPRFSSVQSRHVVILRVAVRDCRYCMYVIDKWYMHLNQKSNVYLTLKKLLVIKGFFFYVLFFCYIRIAWGWAYFGGDKGLHFRNACNLSLTEQFCVP